MKAVHPYLIFTGNAEAAFERYRSIFGGEFRDVVRYEDMVEAGDASSVSSGDRRRVVHISLPLTDTVTLMGSDAPSSRDAEQTAGNDGFVLLETDGVAEAERVFERLAEGGHVDMALQQTSWAERYGKCRDRFGVDWMVMYGG